ncbi:hypothetical protein [Nostoc sp.]
MPAPQENFLQHFSLDTLLLLCVYQRSHNRMVGNGGSLPNFNN